MNPQQPNPYMQNAPQQSQPNWFERLLPTIGGIGGGLLGTLASPILGSAAGAGVGSSLGQELENKMTGSHTGVLSTGIQNAAGGLLGGAFGELTGGLLGKAGNLASDVADSSMMKQAGGLITRDEAQALRGMGVSDFSKAAKIAPEVTGAAGGEGAVFHNGMLNALDSAGSNGLKVDLSKEATSWPDLLSSHTASLTDKQISTISGDINNSFAQMAKNSGLDVNRVFMPGKATGELTALEPGATQNLNPRAVFDQGKELMDKGFKISNVAPKDVYGNISDPVKAAQADIYKTLGSQLKERALGTGIGDTPIAITDADKALLKANLSNVAKISPEAYQSLTNIVDNSNTWQDINRAESLWAGVSKASSGIQKAAATTIGTTPTDIAKGTLGMTQGRGGIAKAGVGGFLGSPTANRAETNILSSIAKGGQGKIAQEILPRAIMASTVAAANLPNIAQSVQQGQTMTPGVQPGNITSGAGGTTMQQPGESQFNQLLDLALHQASVNPYMASSVYPLLASLSPTLQHSAVAGAMIPGFESQFGAGGGAAGIGGGGILNTILSHIPGTPQSAARAQAQQITGTLGVNPALAPNFLQSPETAGTQLSTLSGIVQALGGAAPVQ